MIAAGTCCTVIMVVPVTFPAAAVTMVVPLATAVTRPLDASTVTTLGFVDDQLKVVPLIVAPVELRAVAVSWRVAPIDAILVAVDTSMVATTGGPGGAAPSPQAATTAMVMTHLLVTGLPSASP